MLHNVIYWKIASIQKEGNTNREIVFIDLSGGDMTPVNNLTVKMP